MDECMQIEWEYKCKALRGDHAFLHKVWLGGHCPAHLLLQISLVLPSMEWMEIMPVCLRVRQVWRPVLLAHYITGPVCPFSEGPVPSGGVFPLLFWGFRRDFCLWFFFLPYSSPGTLAQCVC